MTNEKRTLLLERIDTIGSVVLVSGVLLALVFLR